MCFLADTDAHGKIFALRAGGHHAGLGLRILVVAHLYLYPGAERITV